MGLWGVTADAQAQGKFKCGARLMKREEQEGATGKHGEPWGTMSLHDAILRIHTAQNFDTGSCPIRGDLKNKRARFSGLSLVQRDATCWYKTRLHSQRPMCKHIGLTSTMWSIKMRSLSIRHHQRLWLRSSLCSKEHYLPLAKEQQGWLMKGALTDGRHRMEARSRSSHRPQSPCSLLRCP